MKLFLSIEGVECTGKTAVVNRLAELASQAGISVSVKPEFPHELDNDINDALSRSIFVSQSFRYGAAASLFFMFYGEAVSIFNCKQDVDLVIADRYLDSIAIYQRRFLPASSRTVSPNEFLSILESLARAAGLPIPDCTIWLDAPMAATEERFNQREKRALSNEEIERICCFREDYAKLASSHSRFRKADATQEVDQVADNILHGTILPALGR
jgi:thymidylate kinase